MSNEKIDKPGVIVESGHVVTASLPSNANQEQLIKYVEGQLAGALQEFEGAPCKPNALVDMLCRQLDRLWKSTCPQREDGAFLIDLNQFDPESYPMGTLAWVKTDDFVVSDEDRMTVTLACRPIDPARIVLTINLGPNGENDEG